MARAELPENGELRLGAVALPPGRRVVPDGHEPVAWVTSTAVPDPGRVWSALRDMRSRTGLVPVLLDDDPGADAEDYFFYDPVDRCEKCITKKMDMQRNPEQTAPLRPRSRS